MFFCSYYRILSAEIPFSYYVITAQNNIFEVGTSTIGPWTTVFLPVGNYTKDSILPAMKSVIESALPGTVTVTYNSSLLKLVFASTASLYFRFPENILACKPMVLPFSAASMDWV